ncbi:MAG: BrnA antitoxin family protein [Candidatus Bipolaricaulota bacterium]|nr:BrnA antitoxin family protein [Candidatus Bipolaricaulota bacterium]MDW8110219.1 CopG family antitoxin [Candidatus Bipolaricaulota bacterium]MDW8328881.1 CopG family antitoxin [Candidatus Bipolaricaulota bacterium]
MPRKKQVDPIPEEFSSYEEAAEFWDTHNPEDYPDAFRPVKAIVELRRRRYEIEIELDEELVKRLRAVARRRKKTISQLASEILRKELVALGK